MHAAGGKAIFMSDDERDAAVGQPLRLPGKRQRMRLAYKFVIPSEVEESLISGIREKHAAIWR
jgi:hypothetical protein